MRASQLPIFTLKEDPKDAQVVSHRLLVRAGYVRKQAAGLYSYLPFGYIVHRKIEDIIREEMNKHGGVEVHLPVITPAELWQKSGRWQQMGPEMMRFHDRHGTDFCLGPTHEEAITELASQYLQSYKQLPINLYQIGTKYRDEIRPRYGLIRCREFVMKDAYSFHLDAESLEETYQTMRACYRAIFERCGLETIAVEADSGNMGGAKSEEFMVASAIGEETLLLCEDSSCGYRGNQEKTAFIANEAYPTGSQAETENVHTPNAGSIADVSKLLSIDEKAFVKAVIYENAESVVMAFVPGDREASLVKVQNASGTIELELASTETIESVTQAKPGFAGPIGMNVGDVKAGAETKLLSLLIDKNLKGRANLVVGANETDYHVKFVTEGRDFRADQYFDLVTTTGGDTCPQCNKAHLKETKGIEVGHIFQLGKKYSTALKAEVLDQQGKALTTTMGCYGIGVGRTLQTSIEQHHDDKGIIWPESLSPYRVYLTALYKTEDELAKAAEVYEALKVAKQTVYFDDRKERPGIKFNDAELVGFPLQVVVGKTFFESGKVELRDRASGDKSELTLEELMNRLS